MIQVLRGRLPRSRTKRLHDLGTAGRLRLVIVASWPLTLMTLVLFPYLSRRYHPHAPRRHLPSPLRSIGAENDPDTWFRLIGGLWTRALSSLERRSLS